MFFKIKPHPDLKVCVIIPVKDEAENICHCLDALRLQVHEDGTPFSTSCYEILILTNNCEDDSYSIIKKYQYKYPKLALQVENISFPAEKANIGTARRFLMDMAYNRFSSLKKPRGIISSTDGDTQVDRFWLSKIITEVERGCDVVGGEIITEFKDAPYQKYHELDICYHNLIAELEYLIDPQSYNPWPSHFQCFGASLAVTCDLYKKAGCLPSIPFLEDVAFCKELELKDAKIRKSPHVKVYTSSRTSGRVERGLSQQLAWFELLNNEQIELKVECAASITSRLKIKKHLRTCWDDNRINTLHHAFTEKYLREWIYNAIYFGEVWAKAQEFLESIRWFEQWSDEPIEKVIRDLSIYKLEIEIED